MTTPAPHWTRGPRTPSSNHASGPPRLSICQRRRRLRLRRVLTRVRLPQWSNGRQPWSALLPHNVMILLLLDRHLVFDFVPAAWADCSSIGAECQFARPRMSILGSPNASNTTGTTKRRRTFGRPTSSTRTIQLACATVLPSLVAIRRTRKRWLRDGQRVTLWQRPTGRSRVRPFQEASLVSARLFGVRVFVAFPFHNVFSFSFALIDTPRSMDISGWAWVMVF